MVWLEKVKPEHAFLFGGGVKGLEILISFGITLFDRVSRRTLFGPL